MAKVNYIVVIRGHVACFEQFSAAMEFAVSFEGKIFNYWGLWGLPPRRMS